MNNDGSVQRAAGAYWPDNGPVTEEGVAELGLSVAAVARRMGVAPATLRTWDRRYGIGPGHHEAGKHRRYTDSDLARLEYMRRLVITGVPPADAARAARSFDPHAEPVAPADISVSRSGGGDIVALPGASATERGLARAAQALDTAACEEILSDAIAHHGVVWTWNLLVMPVLVAVGERWQNTGRGIEVEHALSSAVQAAFTTATGTLTSPVNARVVLLASAPGDPHTLVIWAVAAALAERGIATRVLGAALPAESLALAVERLGPAAVFVWAQIPGTADPAVLSALPSVRPRCQVIIGGRGWTGQLPEGVVAVHDLTDTVARIARAVGE